MLILETIYTFYRTIKKNICIVYITNKKKYTLFLKNFFFKSTAATINLMLFYLLGLFFFMLSIFCGEHI